MAQGTGYIYNQRGDVVLGNRSGTTRNQPSSYKPFKLLKGVDTTITFFIRDVNGCKVQLHEKSIKAQLTKHDGHAVLVQKNLRITDYENGVATLHLSPGDIANLDAAFYNILLTYTSNDNKITALHVDQNYRHCYVAEVVDDCGPMEMSAQSLYSDHALDLPASTQYPIGIESSYWAIAFTARIDIDISIAISASLTINSNLGCHAAFTVSYGISFVLSGSFFYSISLTAIGVGYQVGDTITVLGSNLGGIDGVNDLVLSVTSVNASGGILAYTVSGNPNTDVYTIVTNRLDGPATTVANCGGINTFSITYGGGATGVVTMQATLSSNPSENDWFDVPNTCGYNKQINVSNKTGTEAYIVDGMFMYVRFKFTLSVGWVDKIHYRR